MELGGGDEGSAVGLGMSMNFSSGDSGSSASTPIDSSNIGFQLLKKHGWREGTGLGVSQQGRLEPVETYVKKNKRGLGADQPKKAKQQPKSKTQENPSDTREEQVPKKAAKGISKKMKKLQEFEKRMQEREFDRSFFREFWPDNV